MDKWAYKFLTRWLVSSLGLWIAAGFDRSISYNHSLQVLVLAGLLLAGVNMLVKPVLVILSLPAIILTLGLFLFVINGLTVWLVSRLYSSLHVGSFWAAVFAGIVIGLVNYLVTAIVEDIRK